MNFWKKFYDSVVFFPLVHLRFRLNTDQVLKAHTFVCQKINQKVEIMYVLRSRKIGQNNKYCYSNGIHFQLF